jgi:hypothetical protein
MVLIEMHVSNTVNPNGRAQYIWMVGQPWPVPVAEDPFIMRIEAFGPELDAIQSYVPMGRKMEGASYPLMDWLRNMTQVVSEVIRERASRAT